MGRVGRSCLSAKALAAADTVTDEIQQPVSSTDLPRGLAWFHTCPPVAGMDTDEIPSAGLSADCAEKRRFCWGGFTCSRSRWGRPCFDHPHVGAQLACLWRKTTGKQEKEEIRGPKSDIRGRRRRSRKTGLSACGGKPRKTGREGGGEPLDGSWMRVWNYRL